MKPKTFLRVGSKPARVCTELELECLQEMIVTELIFQNLMHLMPIVIMHQES